MSTKKVEAYHVHCDLTGCDEVSEPSVSLDMAEEAALEAGWSLSTTPADDMCPLHAGNT